MKYLRIPTHDDISELILLWTAENEARAKELSVDGTYEVVDNGELEPPTNEELAEENKRLKAQMEMQAQNITFLENCLLEMGDIVYA